MPAGFLCPFYVRDPRNYHGPGCGDAELPNLMALYAHIDRHLRAFRNEADLRGGGWTAELERRSNGARQVWMDRDLRRALSIQGSWNYLWLTLFPATADAAAAASTTAADGTGGSRCLGAEWMRRDLLPRDSLQWLLLGENRGLRGEGGLVRRPWMVWREGVERLAWRVCEDGSVMGVEFAPSNSVEWSSRRQRLVRNNPLGPSSAISKLLERRMRRRVRQGRPIPRRRRQQPRQQQEEEEVVEEDKVEVKLEPNTPDPPRRSSLGMQLGYLFGSRPSLTAIPGNHMRPVLDGGFLWPFAWPLVAVPLRPPNGGLVMGTPTEHGIMLPPVLPERQGFRTLPPLAQVVEREWNGMNLYY